MKTAIVIVVILAVAAFLWFKFAPKPLKAEMVAAAQEPIVLQGTGIRYTPHAMPVELGGGLKEWGRTPDGSPVIASRDPATYQPWEWQ